MDGCGCRLCDFSAVIFVVMARLVFTKYVGCSLCVAWAGVWSLVTVLSLWIG